MGHRQKQKFSTAVSELQKGQEDLEKKFTLLGNAVLTADNANKEDKKYLRGITITTNQILTQVDEHKTKLEELEVFHQVAIENYSELVEKAEYLEKYANDLEKVVITTNGKLRMLHKEFVDLRKGLEWFLRIICVIVGVFLLACISGVF